ncbi:hypothetical protein [Sediminibacterium goheungense]|uniref:Uncharacterized protein n=1 Tax=Sediminibacterium goheungense TaxID=1086393 RepID=A0A4R6IX36_9BACT|nr:hypothetical protein [Sediminibacterium goheungense]TDO26455.1 hypothetical protein BC659_1761 [Sediminibacterium goheungense]
MKKRYLFLPVAATVVLFTVGYITENFSNKKLCQTSKNCPSKQEKPPAKSQGSSPDEIHYGGLNRLIVSTFR